MGLLLGGWLFIMGYRHLINREPQIILSNDGVQIAGAPFYSWGDVQGEDTQIIRGGKNRRTCFIYNCPEGKRQVELNELDIRIPDLENRLLVYRGRYMQKHN